MSWYKSYNRFYQQTNCRASSKNISNRYFWKKNILWVTWKYVYLQNASTYTNKYSYDSRFVFWQLFIKTCFAVFIEHPEAQVRTDLHETLTEFWFGCNFTPRKKSKLFLYSFFANSRLHSIKLKENYLKG
jgi:hypothetical protein